MNCRFCNAEMEDGTVICPSCGEDNTEKETPVEETSVEETPVEETPVEEAAVEEPPAEETAEEEIPEEEPKPRKKRWKAVVAITCCAVLLLGLAAGIAIGMGIDLRPRANDVKYKDNYTVADEELTDALMDKVVATAAGKELTNGQLQVYYWLQFYSFMENYSYYLSSFGLDYTKPLSSQFVPDTDTTWEQYFLDLALSTWHRYQVLAVKAEETGFQPPLDLQEQVDLVKNNLEQTAQAYEFESVEALIQGDMGPGSSLQDYLDYMKTYYHGVSYFESLYNQVETTDEAIKAYFLENAEAMETNYHVTMDSGNVVDVRHILFCPEGGMENEDGTVTYSDEEWAACLAKAQAALDSWKAGEATEESFAALAAEQTEDSGSQSTGGLYTSVYKGQMMEGFENWCFDESRQSGDTGLVQTPYGYHVMYFVAAEQGWYRYGRDGYISEECSRMLEEFLEEKPIDVKYKHIALGQVDFTAVK